MGGKRPDKIDSNDESFISLQEASHILKMPEREVQILIRNRRLVAFQLGNQLVRLRKDQVWELQSRKRISSELFPDDRTAKAPAPIMMKASVSENIRDFFYFNDFYILSTIIVAALLYLILSSQI